MNKACPAVLAVLLWLSVDSSIAQGDSDPLCGINCLYAALVALDFDPGEYTTFVEQSGEPEARGFSLGRLAELAQTFGDSSLAVQTSLERLQWRQGRFACIAHVDGDHFVLLGDIGDQGVWVVDPPQGGWVAPSALQTRWDRSPWSPPVWSSGSCDRQRGRPAPSRCSSDPKNPAGCAKPKSAANRTTSSRRR